MSPSTAKISRNGQVSLPAEVRRRWHAERVVVVDRGDYVIVRPVPDDILAAVSGAHAGPGPATRSARADERAREADRDRSRR
ncbi:AbrB/MazE/SpoVT family DNA-binding domain-containing protein [Nostocoides australiense]|nr:AbrB/MazE/SpoVT family DNA-binding domain-containing protein [Actinomycetota bacterium]MCB1300956.1 AbrB/MazE/SpoVT family DNA-binding domain-containing protein [Tetrasphaera sp.]HPF80480.1 AbrB/MazE/SpoVT family DNA-binding domain-containing protein [Tetrasphaera australiensis]HRW02124.1 AbrB/MazE/SpoVT family DNA-binding domain-containing protein [Tetrasphaera sp.]